MRRKPSGISDQTIHEMITLAAEDRKKDFPHRDTFLRHSIDWYLEHPEIEPCDAFVRWMMKDYIAHSRRKAAS